MSKPNWKNQTIWTGDNLDIMRGMNSESVDLIYLDPPFNSKADYAAPIGSKAAGAAFKDTWTLSDVDAEWINLMEAKHVALHRVLLAALTPSNKSYLAYMAVRLLEMRRLLKPTGTIYIHCDPTASHYLKLVMDAVFGTDSFRNEIIWKRTPAKALMTNSTAPRSQLRSMSRSTPASASTSQPSTRRSGRPVPLRSVPPARASRPGSVASGTAHARFGKCAGWPDSARGRLRWAVRGRARRCTL